MSKHSVTIRGLRMVTICWSSAWSNRTSPSKWVGLGSQLAASSVYGDLTCSVHTVNNLCMFNCQCHVYFCNRGPYVRLAFSWNKDIIIIITMPEMLHNDIGYWHNFACLHIYMCFPYCGYSFTVKPIIASFMIAMTTLPIHVRTTSKFLTITY